MLWNQMAGFAPCLPLSGGEVLTDGPRVWVVGTKDPLAPGDLGSAELLPPSDRKIGSYLREREKAQ